MPLGERSLSCQKNFPEGEMTPASPLGISWGASFAWFENARCGNLPPVNFGATQVAPTYE